MLENIAGWLLKAYKASPRLMLILCLISGLLFFLPVSVLHTFALDEFAVHNRTWTSLVFWFSLLTTISYPVEAGAKQLFAKWESRLFRKRLITQLQTLDAEERGILKSFMHRRTQYFEMENGAVAALVSRGILYYPLDTADSRRFPVTIADWAWKCVHEHPELLQ
jgi:hypothetical protein